MTNFDLFNRIFGTWEDEIAYNVDAWPPVPWTDFWLNPRALRGSDFLMRWSQGYWSEERLCDAVNATGQYYAIPWGPSGAAPDDDPRSTELYLLRLQEAGLGTIKRPDLLVFRRSDRENVDRDVDALGGTENLPFTPEDAPEMRRILSHAIVAIECENSLWVAQQMPDFGTPMKPMARLGGKHGLKKNAVLPTVIIKDEDRDRLRAWQAQTGIPGTYSTTSRTASPSTRLSD